MRLPKALSIAVAFLFATSALASAPIAVKDYAAQRRRHEAVSLKTASADPAAFVGKVVEIRGRVSGISKGRTGGTMIMCTQDGGSHLIEADELPADHASIELACLVTVGEGSTHTLSDLKLLCCTYDADLRRVDEQAKRAQEAKEARLTAQASAKPKATQPSAGKSVAPQPTLTADQMIRAYRDAVKRFNRKLTDTQADTIARSVLGFSYRYGVDARLVCAVILAESNFRVYATSSCGAMGLGQLMPTTAAGLGVDNAFDPVQNIYGSVRYIRSMLDRTSGKSDWNELTWGDLSLALAAYNAGPGAVKKHGGVPPYRETQNYVRKVVSIYKQLCGVRG